MHLSSTTTQTTPLAMSQVAQPQQQQLQTQRKSSHSPAHSRSGSISKGAPGEPQQPGFLATSAVSPSNREFPVYQVNWPIYSVPACLIIPADQKELVPAPEAISKKRYATSVDERNYLTVYEYMVNNQWIIWDYHTGYVHLTGLWKAIGNSKADIVKLIDNSPDLEAVIRRVRGGYLKIQGTWVPYDIARALASRTCYFIRFALIPLFGEDFPGTCLKPHEPGFGYLQMHFNNSKKKRKRSDAKAQQAPQQLHPHHMQQHHQVYSISPRHVPQPQQQQQQQYSQYPPQMSPHHMSQPIPQMNPPRLSQSAPAHLTYHSYGHASTRPVPISPSPYSYHHNPAQSNPYAVQQPPSPHSQPVILPRIGSMPSPPQQMPHLTGHRKSVSGKKTRPILIRPDLGGRPLLPDESAIIDDDDVPPQHQQHTPPYGNSYGVRRPSAGIVKPRPRRKSRLSYDETQTTSLLSAAIRTRQTASSSESEQDDEDYYKNFFARRQSISEYNPANPAKQESPEEIMEVLQAIRSLQQLSTGSRLGGKGEEKKVMDINSVLS